MDNRTIIELCLQELDRCDTADYKIGYVKAMLMNYVDPITDEIPYSGCTEIMNPPEIPDEVSSDSASFIKKCEELGLTGSKPSTLAKEHMSLSEELEKRYFKKPMRKAVQDILAGEGIKCIEDLCDFYDDPIMWAYEFTGLTQDDIDKLHGIYISANEDCGATAAEKLKQFVSFGEGFDRTGHTTRIMNYLNRHDIYTKAQLFRYVKDYKTLPEPEKKRMVSQSTLQVVTDKVRKELL